MYAKQKVSFTSLYIIKVMMFGFPFCAVYVVWFEPIIFRNQITANNILRICA